MASSVRVCYRHSILERSHRLLCPVDRLGRFARGQFRGVEFHTLLSLAAGERHGYGILQDIGARGEASVPDVGHDVPRWLGWWTAG